jgi:hypothetical protein
MGLEALFSEGGDNLRYKLAVRGAKVLAQYGMPSLEVKAVLAEAYKVRNRFVHGEHFRTNDRDRLAQQAGDVQRFVARLLDYLRLSLVTFVVLRPNKNELLSLIDNALVDSRPLAGREEIPSETTRCKRSRPPDANRRGACGDPGRGAAT